MKFFVIINNEQQGPFTIKELASKRITPDTEVWTDGMDDWALASEVPQLVTLIRRTRTVPPARKRNPKESSKTANRSISVARSKKAETDDEITLLGYTFNKRKFFTTVGVVAALLLLIITNPSQQRHSEAVHENLTAHLNSNVDQATSAAGGFGDLIGGVAKAFTGFGSGLASTFVTRSNFLIFSVGHIGNKTVSFGILGMVFTFDGWIDQTYGVANGLGNAAQSLGNAIEALDKLDKYSKSRKNNNTDYEMPGSNAETDELLDSMDELADNIESLTNRAMQGDISESELEEQDEFLGTALQDHQKRLMQLSNQGKVSAAQKRRAEQIASRLLSLKNKIGDNL